MPKRIKVLFVDHTPFVGGAQLCLARDLAYLSRKKIHPVLAIDKDSKFDYVYNKSKVKIYKISFGRLKKIDPSVLPQLLSSIKEFLELIEDLKVDIVVANTTRALILAGLAKDYKLALRLLNRPSHSFKLVSYVRDYDYPKWLFNTLRVSVDKFLMVSKSIESFYREGKPKSEIIYLGSDLDQILKVKSAGRTKFKVEEIEQKYGLKRGDFVIGFIGRLVDWKGPLFLLESFRGAKDEQMKLLFFGSGKNQPGDVEEKLKKEIRKRGLEDKVKLVGFMEDQQLMYSLIDCFVLSSLKAEPFATSIIEAALAKVPVVATYTGGTPEFIKSGKNGLLVKPKDVNQLAYALLRVKKERGLAKKLVANAYRDAQKFKEEKFAKNLEGVLLKLV